MIELNKPYTTEELAKELGLSISTFRKFWRKIVGYLDNYYIYYCGVSEQDKRKTTYIFIGQLEEFAGYSKIKSDKEELVYNLTMEIIKEDKWQTDLSISREIFNKVTDLSFSDIAVYVHEILDKVDKEFGLVCEVEKGVFQKIDKEEIEKIRSSFVEITEQKIKDCKLTGRKLIREVLKIVAEDRLQLCINFAKEHEGRFPVEAYKYKI